MGRRRDLPASHGYRLLVAGVFILAAFLRFYGQNWDQGLYLHPDERFIAIVSSDRVSLPSRDRIDLLFDPAHSPLNPRRDGPTGQPESFAYGSLPIYVQGAVSWLISLVSDTDFGSYAETYRVGRPLSGLMDLLTLLFVFLLARRLAHQYAALVAAALYAFAVLPIQLAHFFTVDVWLSCFVTASLYLAIRYVDAPTLGRALALAVPVGCAFATKASVPSLLVPLAAAFGWVVWRSHDRVTPVGHAAAAGLLALAVFSVFEPYAIVRLKPFLDDIRLQARIVRGQFDVPFTRQFVGLSPGLYELRNLFLYALGPGLLLAGVVGIVPAVRRVVRERDAAWAILLLWVGAYVPTLLITEARFLRYALPLVPACVILAAAFLVRLPRLGRVPLARVVTAAVLIVTATWAMGFVSIYARENPRIAASRWMHANIPSGSRITAETWDDAMPVPYPGAPPSAYVLISSDIYQDEPPEEKARSIAATLQQADYVILSSDRVIASVDNLPWRYAVQNEYYRRLLGGQLGFQLVYDGELRPELFGFRFDDSASDESFTVYDHPRVRIFKKVDALSEAEIRDRLLWGINQPWEPQRYPSAKWLQLDRPADTIETTNDASWNRWAIGHTIVAIVAWLAAVELIGLAALPVAAVLLPRTRDRGAAASRLIGVLIVGWLVWIGASLGFWEARASTVVVMTGLLAIAAWGFVDWRARRGRPIALPNPAAWMAWAAVWLAGFGGFLVLRAVYPDVWQTWFGGEKPFELAYIRAVARSTVFPPYDPWYADGTINYYYYGWHLLSSLTKLSGVGVSLAFQFAIPTFAGFMLLQTASLGMLLFERGRRRIATRHAIAAAALCTAAVVLIGNLDAMRQVLEQRGDVRERFDFWRSTRVIDYTINEFPWFSFIWADVHPHVINFPIFILLVTLLAHQVLQGGRRAGRTLRDWVTESAPAGVASALTLGTVAMTNSWDAPLAVGLTVAASTYAGWLWSWRGALVGFLAGCLISAGAFVLFWPFYARFYSVVEGISLTHAGSDLGQFLTMWGIACGVVTLALFARLLDMPRAARDIRDGLLYGLLACVAGGFTAAVGLLVGNGKGPAAQELVGLALTAVVIGLAAASCRPTRMRPALLEPLVALVVVAGGISVWRPAAAVALGIAAATLMPALLALRQPSRAVPWLLCALGALIIAATEVVYIADDLRNSPWERMNTVFKFYLQAWMLLAIGSALLLANTWRRARIRLPQWFAGAGTGIVAQPDADVDSRMHQASRTGHRASVARAPAFASLALIALGLAYPLLGTPVRLDQDMPSSPESLTLDGYAWMRGGQILNGTGEVLEFSGDLAAIQWLNENVHGNPIILEASIGPYRGNGSRISSATGLPTVLGWDRHQRQQRYGSGIDDRVADVRAIYNETDPDRKLEMLRRYRVSYVIVGDVERRWNTPENTAYYASEAGLAAFDALLSRGLFLVFESGATRIYALQDFPRIPPANDAKHDL